MTDTTDGVIIITPEEDDDEISEGLCLLTHELVEYLGTEHHGALGGIDGYGENFENDVFMMHSFCWCDQQDCPWCARCECPDGPYDYTIAGRTVDEAEWKQYWAAMRGLKSWSREGVPPQPWGVWPRDTTSALQPHVPRCRYCRGEFGNAPNFRHKASGFEARWYKWIGRDMELVDGNGLPFREILQDCLASIGRWPQ